MSRTHHVIATDKNAVDGGCLDGSSVAAVKWCASEYEYEMHADWLFRSSFVSLRTCAHYVDSRRVYILAEADDTKKPKR